MAHGVGEPPKGHQPDPRDNPHPPEDPDCHYGTKKKELDHIIDLRDDVAKQTYLIGWFALGVWLLMLVVHTITALCGHEVFNSKDLITITTGATVNALGVYAIVVTGLFFTQKQDK